MKSVEWGREVIEVCVVKLIECVSSSQKNVCREVS